MWLHLPRSIASACAPEPADWISPSGWPLNASASTRELFVTLSGKPTLRPLSWRGWKTRPWMMRLSGMTFAPSTAARGVAAWIVSLPATPASLSPAPANDWLRRIRDTFGPRWIASLAKLNLGSSSSKMLAPTFAWDSELSDEICSDEATLLRRDCSQRQKSVPAMNANGSSSWPTAKAEQKAGTRGNDPRHGRTLDEEATKWLTPNCPNGGRSVDKETVLSKGLTEDGKRTVGLESQVKFWPTARSNDTQGGSYQNQTDGTTQPTLVGAAKQWSTPRSSPNENRTTKHAPSHGNGHGRTLAGDAMMLSWPTPQAADSKMVKGGKRGPEENPSLGTAAKNHRFSHPAPATSTAGAKSSGSTRRLNPRFVEWLMGWPVGWTDCASPVTEWSRYKSRMQSSLWALLKSAAPMAHDG